MKQFSVGVALGSGSARGWAHIGVLQALKEMGIEPQVIAGCSIGSMVGASCAAGKLDELETWVKTLGWRDVFSFLDVHLSGGLIQGRKLFQFFEKYMAGLDFEDLPIPCGAVATDLETGREVWLRHGALATAIRASISLPGLFTPYRTPSGRYLLDGGLVNPIPVTLCKALGADVVIGVNLNNQLVGKHMRSPKRFGFMTDPYSLPQQQTDADSQSDELMAAAGGALQSMEQEQPFEFVKKISEIFGFDDDPEEDVLESANPPGMLDVVATSINIMQDRITRSRVAGDPPDVMINPNLAHLGLMDFYRAEEAIEEGRKAVRRVADQLEDYRQK